MFVRNRENTEGYSTINHSFFNVFHSLIFPFKNLALFLRDFINLNTSISVISVESANFLFQT
jgi:hypothetical protein